MNRPNWVMTRTGTLKRSRIVGGPWWQRKSLENLRQRKEIWGVRLSLLQLTQVRTTEPGHRPTFTVSRPQISNPLKPIIDRLLLSAFPTPAMWKRLTRSYAILLLCNRRWRKSKIAYDLVH